MSRVFRGTCRPFSQGFLQEVYESSEFTKSDLFITPDLKHFFSVVTLKFDFLPRKWFLPTVEHLVSSSPRHISHPPLLLCFLQAAPCIPRISRHDGIPIQMRTPAQTRRWTKPQPKRKYPHHVRIGEATHDTSTSSTLSAWGVEDSANVRGHAAWTG